MAFQAGPAATPAGAARKEKRRERRGPLQMQTHSKHLEDLRAAPAHSTSEAQRAALEVLRLEPAQIGRSN
eukprot:5070564-Alexandrium_andersonii.AAC.1